MFISLLCCSCLAQKGAEQLPWKSFVSEEAGVKASFPCEPETKVGVFQKTPKLARAFDIKCEYKGLTYSIHLSEHFREFDESKIIEKFDVVEDTFREYLGENAGVLKSTDITLPNGSAARIFEAKSGEMMFKQLHTQNQRGAYNVSVMTKKGADPAAVSSKEFDEIAQKFFDSFEILKK